jgi:hypothetical protein
MGRGKPVGQKTKAVLDNRGPMIQPIDCGAESHENRDLNPARSASIPTYNLGPFQRVRPAAITHDLTDWTDDGSKKGMKLRFNVQLAHKVKCRAWRSSQIRQVQ